MHNNTINLLLFLEMKFDGFFKVLVHFSEFKEREPEQKS
jgi:hypothetical protein